VPDSSGRRTFLKNTGLAIGASIATAIPGNSSGKQLNGTLQVWSCGGLAEAMMPANARFTEKNGCDIAYTGAFAGALGKSLLSGGAKTEVFAPRVLELSKKLKAQGKMLHFAPLCYTRYVMITPPGNPAGIKTIEDINNPGVKTVIIPNASPPGGQASMIILKKAGVQDAAIRNAVTTGDCVQTSVPDIVSGKGHVAIVEYRLTQLPQFKNKVEVIDISEEHYPPPPIPFTIGLMKWVNDRELAEEYIGFILSDEGQQYFQKAGFIPALSEEGKRLTAKYGVKDV
jgi:molybdate transport system substrate-binding protein